MAEKKKKWINPRTGQITSNPEVAKNVGATREYKPSGNTKTISPGAAASFGMDVSGQVTPEQYKQAQERMKILGQGGRKVQTPQEVQAQEQLLEQQRQAAEQIINPQQPTLTPEQEEIINKASPDEKGKLLNFLLGTNPLTFGAVKSVEKVPVEEGEFSPEKAVGLGVDVALGAAAGVGGTAFETINIGGEVVQVSKAAVTKNTLQTAAKTGIGKQVLKYIGIGGILGASGFSLNSLIGRSSKRIEEIKTATTTLGENIAGWNTGMSNGLDPQWVLTQTAELKRQLDIKEQTIKLMMIHSINTQTHPEKAHDAVEELNKMRNKIYNTERTALKLIYSGGDVYNEEEFALWLKDMGFAEPEQLIPPEKGEVPFKPFAKETDFELRKVAT